MAISPLHGHSRAGIAAKRTEDVNPQVDPLFTGDSPVLLVTDEPVATGQTLAELTVVGFNVNGQCIPAVEGTTQAVGILVHDVDTSSGVRTAKVYRGGCFNPALLVWDASYNTDELQRTAFYGAPTPTNLVVRKIETLTV